MLTVISTSLQAIRATMSILLPGKEVVIEKADNLLLVIFLSGWLSSVGPRFMIQFKEYVVYNW